MTNMKLNLFETINLGMRLSRRAWLLAGSLSITASWLPAQVHAQAAWPNHPIRLIVPYAPGGGTDIVARAIAAKLSTRLGQPIVIDNKSGAGGAIGFEAGLKAPADGYTLLFVTSAYATNAATGKKQAYDPVKDMVPIGQIGNTPLVVSVAQDSPVKTLRELVDLARAKPEAVSYGSSGVGSMSHLGMELFAAEGKMQLLHVPYKGMAPAFTDLMAGLLQTGLSSFATVSQFIDAGKVRGLAVTGTKRTPFAPQLPTTAEAGFPGFQIDFWWGFVAPARTPPAIVKRLNEELNLILAQAETRELLAREAAVPTPGTPEEFGKLVAQDVVRWTRLVKERNIKTE